MNEKSEITRELRDGLTVGHFTQRFDRETLREKAHKATFYSNDTRNLIVLTYGTDPETGKAIGALSVRFSFTALFIYDEQPVH